MDGPSHSRQPPRRQSLQKMPSMDEQMRRLVPGKVTEDDHLIEYDALLLDRFMDILQDLHGEEMRDKVQFCYELASECDNADAGEIDAKLEELGEVLKSLDAGESIVFASSLSHMLNLTNLAEEVQIAFRRRVKLKKREFGDENSAITESDLEETFRKLVNDLKKSPMEIFEALKSQTVDLVLTAHPTQSIRRSLLQKHGRIRNCLSQLCQKDITPDEKQEFDEALQREVTHSFAFFMIYVNVEGSWYGRLDLKALFFHHFLVR